MHLLVCSWQSLHLLQCIMAVSAHSLFVSYVSWKYCVAVECCIFGSDLEAINSYDIERKEGYSRW
jgi:hypothetical protein